MDLGNAEGSLYTAGGSSNALNDLGIKILMNARNVCIYEISFWCSYEYGFQEWTENQAYGNRWTLSVL